MFIIKAHVGLKNKELTQVNDCFQTKCNAENGHYGQTQVRAQSIVDYLILKGIPKERLIARGHEGDSPLIPDSEIEKLKSVEEKEAAHATNRRIEFKILRTDYHK